MPGKYLIKCLILLVGSFMICSTIKADEIVWARYGDIDSLDPHKATSTLSLQVWSLIYDTMLATDKDGNIVPHVAKSWSSSSDGRVYTFELNDGIKCHDGTALDANDIKYTIDKAFNSENPSLTKGSWGPITEVKVISPVKIQFTLEKPFVALISFLADSFSSIICDSNRNESGFGTSVAIGSGPWKFNSWAKGDRIVLEKNPSYRNFGKLAKNSGAPYMDGLIITVVPEPQARLAALKTGEVHVAEPPFDDVPAIKDSGDLAIIVAENTGQNVFWEFAVHRPPFNDKRARLAVGHATDPATAIDLIYGDLSIPEACPVSRGVFGNDQEFCKKYRPDYDPEKAKALLAEMGFGEDNPLETSMIVWTGGNRQKLAEIFQAQLAEVNIKAEIEIMDIGSMNARVRQENENKSGTKGSMDMMTWSWYDPDILYALWHTPGAYRGYTTPELDKLLEETRVLSDPTDRIAVVQEVFKHLLENGVHIPLYTPGWEWVFAVRPEVKGFMVAPFVYPIFSDVKLQN